MTAIPDNQPPRALYGAAMLLSAALGVGCAFAAATLADGGGSAPRAAAAVVAGASLVGLGPAIVGTARHFGVAVLVASVSRLLIVLVAGLVLTQFGGIPARPLWLGAVSGAAVILIAESAASIAVIASLHRRASSQPDLRMQESH